MRFEGEVGEELVIGLAAGEGLAVGAGMDRSKEAEFRSVCAGRKPGCQVGLEVRSLAVGLRGCGKNCQYGQKRSACRSELGLPALSRSGRAAWSGNRRRGCCSFAVGLLVPRRVGGIRPRLMLMPAPAVAPTSGAATASDLVDEGTDPDERHTDGTEQRPIVRLGVL